MKFEVNTKWIKFSVGEDDDLFLLYTFLLAIVMIAGIGACVEEREKGTSENMKNVLIDTRNTPETEAPK